MSRLGIAILGCGGIAKTHAKHLAGVVDLYFCSRSPERAREFNARYSGQGIFDTLEAALNDRRVQGVIVCTPPDRHLAESISILRSGRTALVEKPLCVSREEIATLRESIPSDARRRLMVAENYYYKASTRFLVEALKHRKIGPVSSIRLKKMFTQQSPSWKSRYGALLEGGIHFVALLNDLGSEGSEGAGLVEAVQLDPSTPGVPERYCHLSVRYEAGRRGELYYAWNRPALARGLFQHSMIEGSEGRIGFESNGLYAWTRWHGQRAIHRFLKDISGHGAMVKEFIAVTRGESEPYSNFARAERDLQLVFDAYEMSGLSPQGIYRVS